MTKQKILFICTSNMTRSPACEDILRGSILYETKSAGTSAQAIIPVTQEFIDWADIIIVMCERTDRHATYLRDHFNMGSKDIIDLDLEDFIYDKRDDPLLIKDLKDRLKNYLTLS